MNDKEFNKGIQDLKNISLSHTEKEAMLSHISAYADFHTPKQKQREIWIWSFIQSKSSYAYSALGVLLVVSSTVYGAEKALPGDLLYPFKINVNESLKSALLSNPEAQARWETEKFIRRVEEAEALASEGKLDDTSLLKVEALIDEHFNTLDKLSRTPKNTKTASPETPVETMRTKSAPVAETARVADDSPKVNTMMVSSFSMENTSSTTLERDEFELEIEKHRAILQSIKGNDNKLNERIDQLDRKLFEKAQKRAENKTDIITTPPKEVDEVNPVINIETKDVPDASSESHPQNNSANVLDSQKSRGKNKDR